jgi:TonB family protein
MCRELTLFVLTITILSAAPRIANSQAKQKSSKAGNDLDERPGLALYAPRASYPAAARNNGIQGSGILILHVNLKTGHVARVEVQKSTGYKILDDAAIDADRQWRFRVGSGPKIKVPFTFTLDFNRTAKAYKAGKLWPP